MSQWRAMVASHSSSPTGRTENRLKPQSPSPWRLPSPRSLTYPAIGSQKLKRLYLLRHAKSSWGDPGLADHDRPLAPRGREAARRMAVHMRQAKVRPALVLCSSARRTVQTYKAIAPVLGGSVEVSVEDDLYGASSAELLNRLRVLPERLEGVLVVGHNPGLGDLAMELAGDGDPAGLALLHEKFPTGALATLRLPGRWAKLSPGQAYLESLVVPRDLAR